MYFDLGCVKTIVQLITVFALKIHPEAEKKGIEGFGVFCF